jgi:uncharacterized protein (DUF934 family)
MPRLIRDGAIIEDDAPEIVSHDDWLELADKAGVGVSLEPGEAPAPLLDYLDDIPLVAVNFPAFMDGRGFSYARELRERGYKGELRATGNFIRDQLTYLQRCGFNAFEMADESQLESALESLGDFSESYQAAIDQPQPLFRRRG